MRSLIFLFKLEELIKIEYSSVVIIIMKRNFERMKEKENKKLPLIYIEFCLYIHVCNNKYNSILLYLLIS